MMFDSVAKTKIYLTGTDLGTGAAKWTGDVLASNGKIFSISENTLSLLTINTANEAVTVTADANIAANTVPTGGWRGGVISVLPYDFGTSLYQYSGAVLAPNGIIYLIPQEADRVARLDPATDTVTHITNAVVIGPTDNTTTKWCGGVLAGNGKIYGFPNTKISILEIDPKTISDMSMETPLPGYFNKF